MYQDFTTVEQSQLLLQMGVPRWTANMYHYLDGKTMTDHYCMTPEYCKEFDPKLYDRYYDPKHDPIMRPVFEAPKSFSIKLKLSKRKGRKLRHSLERLCGKRVPKYRSKRELMIIYQKVFFPQGLPMPIDDYLKYTHRQLMNMLVNTAYLVKKERESRHVFLPLPQVETPVEQTH